MAAQALQFRGMAMQHVQVRKRTSLRYWENLHHLGARGIDSRRPVDIAVIPMQTDRVMQFSSSLLLLAGLLLSSAGEA